MLDEIFKNCSKIHNSHLFDNYFQPIKQELETPPEEWKQISFNLFIDDPGFLLYDENDDYEYVIYNRWEKGDYEDQNNCENNAKENFGNWGKYEANENFSTWEKYEENNHNYQNNQSSVQEAKNETHWQQKLVNKNSLKAHYPAVEKIRYFDIHEELQEKSKNDTLIDKEERILSFSEISSRAKKIPSLKPDPKIFGQDIIKITTTKISLVIKCGNCNKTDHLSKYCPHPSSEAEAEICYRCLKTDHEFKNCPLMPCLRCNQLGHKTSYCDASKQIAKCTRCRYIGHFAEDCLSDPIPIKQEILDMSICYFCKQRGHLICPFKNEFVLIREKFEDNSDSEDTEQGASRIKCNDSVYENRNLPDIEIFCPKCSGNHLLSDCGKQLNRGNGDKIRANYAKSFFSVGPSKLAQDKNFMGDSSDND